MQHLPVITHERFSLIHFRSPLLAESLLFSLPAGTEMFHFPAFPPHTLYIQMRVTGHASSRVSPFGHPRITARLPAPRGLSQAPTSFIGSWCQDIHRMPLQTCTYPQLDNPQINCGLVRRTLKDARVHYAVLKQRTDTNPTPHTHPYNPKAETAVYEKASPPERTEPTCSLRTQQRATTPTPPL